ncbi:MAG: hypothetical protein ABIJ56_03440 [Pseudomonadota bacterium]
MGPWLIMIGLVTEMLGIMFFGVVHFKENIRRKKPPVKRTEDTVYNVLAWALVFSGFLLWTVGSLL